MDFLHFAGLYQQKIEAEIENFLKEQKERAAAIGWENQKFTEHLQEFNQRPSKKIRPLLVILGYRLFSSKNNLSEKSLISLASSLEFIHNFLLIHDDIIDQSELRRKKPVLQKTFQKHFFSNRQESRHFGLSLALLAGDLNCSFGWEKIINQPELNAEQKIKLLQELANLLFTVTHGEILDVVNQYKLNTPLKEIKQIYLYKTAYYSFYHPLRFGGLIAEAKEKSLQLLKDYALNLGIAFQIQDDLLDIFGKEKISGKKLGNDLQEKKKTLLLYQTWEKCSPKEKKDLDKIFLKKKVNRQDVALFQKIAENCGAKEYCEKEIKKLTQKAKNSLKKVSLPNQEKEILFSLADYLQKREK